LPLSWQHAKVEGRIMSVTARKYGSRGNLLEIVCAEVCKFVLELYRLGRASPSRKYNNAGKPLSWQHTKVEGRIMFATAKKNGNLRLNIFGSAEPRPPGNKITRGSRFHGNTLKVEGRIIFATARKNGNLRLNFFGSAELRPPEN
jgi:hypothetical protein